MQLRRRLRRVGAIVGTVAIGGLLGFLVPTVVAEYSPAPQQQQQVVRSSAERDGRAAHRP